MKTLLCSAALIALLSTSVAAQRQICFDEATIVANLKSKHDEVEIWTGRLGTVSVALFANPTGTTWTIMARPVPGTLCGMAAGTTWDIPELVEPEPEARPAPGPVMPGEYEA